MSVSFDDNVSDNDSVSIKDSANDKDSVSNNENMSINEKLSNSVNLQLVTITRFTFSPTDILTLTRCHTCITLVSLTYR